jgi:hypothetical protein
MAQPIIGIKRRGTPLAETIDILLADALEDPEEYAPRVSRLVHMDFLDAL